MLFLGEKTVIKCCHVTIEMGVCCQNFGTGFIGRSMISNGHWVISQKLPTFDLSWITYSWKNTAVQAYLLLLLSLSYCFTMPVFKIVNSRHPFPNWQSQKISNEYSKSTAWTGKSCCRKYGPPKLWSTNTLSIYLLNHSSHSDSNQWLLVCASLHFLDLWIHCF